MQELLKDRKIPVVELHLKEPSTEYISINCFSTASKYSLSTCSAMKSFQPKLFQASSTSIRRTSGETTVKTTQEFSHGFQLPVELETILREPSTSASVSGSKNVNSTTDSDFRSSRILSFLFIREILREFFHNFLPTKLERIFCRCFLEDNCVCFS